jgi:hypothetical protein
MYSYLAWNISVADALDRLLILELKCLRVAPDARKIINRQHSELRSMLVSVVGRYVLDSGSDTEVVLGYIADLRTIHSALWDLEDLVRQSSCSLDDYRRITTLNNERAKIKASIDQIFHGHITDPKEYSDETT